MFDYPEPGYKIRRDGGKGVGGTEERGLQVGEGGPGGSVPRPGQKTYYRLPGLLLRGRAEVFSGPKIGF